MRRSWNERGSYANNSNLHRASLHQLVASPDADALGILRRRLDTRIDVDVTDGRGMTPLMHACLYARPGAVDMLLSRGADVSIRSGRGGMRAIDFVRPYQQLWVRSIEQIRGADFGSLRNVEREYVDIHAKLSPKERLVDERRRSGIVKKLLEHHSPAAREYKQEEREELEFLVVKVGRHEYEMVLDSVEYDRGDWEIYRNTLRQFAISKRYKTIAVIRPPPQLGEDMLFAGISGWAHLEETVDPLALMEEMDFQPLECKDKDGDMPGRYYATHAEPQVIAKFLFAEGCRMDWGALQWKPRHPQFSCPFVVPVYVSNVVCEECTRFVDEVNKVTKLKYGFSFKIVEVLAEGSEDESDEDSEDDESDEESDDSSEDESDEESDDSSEEEDHRIYNVFHDYDRRW